MLAFELAPLSAKQVDDMLDRTAAGKLLEGFRGRLPGDRARVVDAILRLAQIALDWQEIQEIEINPLIVMEAGEMKERSQLTRGFASRPSNNKVRRVQNWGKWTY